MRRSVRSLVSMGIILTQIVSSVAYSGSGENLDNSAQEFAAAEMPKVQSQAKLWSEQQETLVPELLAAAERLEQKAKSLIASRGEQGFQSLIDKNQFIVEDPILNIPMEYRMIDGVRVPRFLINDETYIIVDEKLISRNSKHLRQYISRTHIESGPGRPDINSDGEVKKNIFGRDKKKTGRNLTVIYLNDDVTQVEALAKPKPTQWRWWQEYFISKYKHPTIDAFTLALVTGVAMQGTLTLGATSLKSHVLGVDFSMIPTYWSMAYSLGIGTFISFYRNWTVNSGTRATRVLKSQAVSSLYAYGLVMAVTGGDFSDKLSAISVFTSEGAAKNVSILANGVMNNYAKDYWNQIPRLRETTRENAGTISFKVPLINKTVNWQRASLESQMLYLIPWSINMISLLTLATTDWFQIPGTSISFPILQFAGIPIAMQWSKWYSKHLADKAKLDPDMQIRAQELAALAARHEAAWKSSFGMDVKELPSRFVALAKDAKDALKTAASKCMQLIKNNE
jgi:hypothetical protein